MSPAKIARLHVVQIAVTIRVPIKQPLQWKVRPGFFRGSIVFNRIHSGHSFCIMLPVFQAISGGPGRC